MNPINPTKLEAQKTVVAMFATRAFAKEAEEKLIQAGFVEVSIDVVVTPDQVQAVSEVPLHNAPGPNIMPGANTVAPLTPAVVETLEANATARLTLQTPTSRLSEALNIIKQTSGQVMDEQMQTAHTTQTAVTKATSAAQAEARHRL